MLRIRIIGLALVAAFALSAVAVASASAALPELTKPGTMEKVEGEITGKASGATKLETAGGKIVECTAATSAKGKSVNTKETEGTVITFTGCSSPGAGACTSESAKNSGEIITSAIKTKIGYLSGTSGEVGIEFFVTRESTLTATFVKFGCLGGFAKIEVHGALVCRLGKAQHNTPTMSLTLECNKGSTAGSQEFTHIEGGVMTEAKLQSNLNGGTFEASNQQGSGTIEFAEKAELKA